MSKDDKDDYIERLVEYQKHTLDPGFYTGGNIHPVFRASRPNRYGWVLIVGGALGFFIIFAGRGPDARWWQVLFAVGYLALCIFAGVKLLKRRDDAPHYRSSSHHRHRHSRKGHP